MNPRHEACVSGQSSATTSRIEHIVFNLPLLWSCCHAPFWFKDAMYPFEVSRFPPHGPLRRCRAASRLGARVACVALQGPAGMEGFSAQALGRTAGRWPSPRAWSAGDGGLQSWGPCCFVFGRSQKAKGRLKKLGFGGWKKQSQLLSSFC